MKIVASISDNKLVLLIRNTGGWDLENDDFVGQQGNTSVTDLLVHVGDPLSNLQVWMILHVQYEMSLSILIKNTTQILLQIYTRHRHGCSWMDRVVVFYKTDVQYIIVLPYPPDPSMEPCEKSIRLGWLSPVIHFEPHNCDPQNTVRAFSHYSRIDFPEGSLIGAGCCCLPYQILSQVVCILAVPS